MVASAMQRTFCQWSFRFLDWGEQCGVATRHLVPQNVIHAMGGDGGISFSCLVVPAQTERSLSCSHCWMWWALSSFITPFSWCPLTLLLEVLQRMTAAPGKLCRWPCFVGGSQPYAEAAGRNISLPTQERNGIALLSY